MKYKMNGGNMQLREIKPLTDTGLVKAVYSTIDNSSWHCNEEKDYDNYKEYAQELGLDAGRMIRIPQTHSSKVRVVSDCHAGEGIIRPVSVEGYDGMVTNVSKLILTTVEADCVPVYMLDPVKKVIAMVHSGWRGTAGLITVDAINTMVKEYGSSCEDILVCLGPCICGKCYEVGGEIREDFLKNYSYLETERFFIKRESLEDNKFSLDIPRAIKMSVINAGIRECNFYDAPCCTYESLDLCSWRRDKDVSLRMLTGIMLV